MMARIRHSNTQNCRVRLAEAKGLGITLVLAVASLFMGRPARADSSSLYLQCLTNFEALYGEANWHEATYSGAPPDSGYWGDGEADAGNNGGIRGNGGMAVAYATLVVAQPNSPSNATRLAHIRQALNYNAATYYTGGYKSVGNYTWGWGSGSLDTDCSTCNGCADWQSCEWAGSTGLACLLVQSNLIAAGYGATVTNVQNLVASEATHRAGIAPCTLPLNSGDTKAEENAWDSNPICLAAAWMTNNANESLWMSAAQAYLVNCYTLALCCSPTYTTPNTNGDPLASYVSTVTVFPSWALENHGFFHPTYEMVAGMSMADSLLMAQLANTNIAAQLLPYGEHNALSVWTNTLSNMVLGSGDFSYPSGLDWELHDYEQDSYITWMATHFNDPVARWDDTAMAQLVWARMQVNGSNGEFVGVSGGGFYREAVEARRTAIAWLLWNNKGATPYYTNGPATAPGPVIAQYPDTGDIVQRSTNGYVSISYGPVGQGLTPVIMAMIEAPAVSIPTNVYVATPLQPGVIGMGALGSPTAATLDSFVTNANGFTAELTLVNGSEGSTEVYFTSTGQSVGIVEVPHPAGGVTGSSAGSFSTGIENDPLTGGSRLLQWNTGSNTVANMSGTVVNVTNNWICVSGRYGLAAGPAGHFNYTAATDYNRLGAAQDTLAFVESSLLAPRYAVYFPGMSAAQTASNTSLITWVVNGTNGTLTFPGLNGNPTQITANVSASTTNSGTWSVDASGNWSNTNNWSSGTVANGAGNTANFSTLDLTANLTVTLDETLSIGELEFGTTAGTDNWFLSPSSGNGLTMSATTPSIVVGENTATVSVPLAGTSGLTKTGAGTLVLSGSNTISGTLLADSDSAGNDGTFQITTAAALGGMSPILIQDNNAGSSTFQLNGSGGNITVTSPMTIDCRNNATTGIESMAGSNTLAGYISLQTGGSNVTFQSDAGAWLVFTGTNQYIGTLTGPRTYTFTGSGNHLVSGPINSSTNTAPIYIAKTGTGTLYLTVNNGITSGFYLTGGTVNFQALGNLGAGAPLTFNGGTLQYAAGNTADISTLTTTFSAGGATIDTGTNSVTLAGAVGGGGSGALTKAGSGTLALNGANTYTGTTTVNNGTLLVNGSLGTNRVTVQTGGTLGGTGTIGGAVTVQAGGTLAPGNNAIGSLAINKGLTNTGTFLFKLSKSGATLTNDTVKGVSSLLYGGTLQLSIVSGTPTVSNSFKLFYATNYSSSFASVSPATPGPGLVWVTNNIPVNGTLSIALGTVHPQIGQVSLNGANLVFNGTGGAAGYNFTVLSSTNVAAPLATWTVAGGGNCDNNGNFIYTNAIAPGSGQLFLGVRIP